MQIDAYSAVIVVTGDGLGCIMCTLVMWQLPLLLWRSWKREEEGEEGEGKSKEREGGGEREGDKNMAYFSITQGSVAHHIWAYEGEVSCLDRL